VVVTDTDQRVIGSSDVEINKQTPADSVRPLLLDVYLEIRKMKPCLLVRAGRESQPRKALLSGLRAPSSLGNAVRWRRVISRTMTFLPDYTDLTASLCRLPSR
jgi:hypothetical protein